MFFWQYIITGSWSIKFILIITLICFSMLISIFFISKNKLDIFKSYHISFERSFWSGVVLEELYLNLKKNNQLNHPTGMLFTVIMEEWIQTINNKSNDINYSIKRIEIATEKGLKKIESYIKNELNFISIFSIIILGLSSFSLLFQISDLFLNIGQTGIMNIESIVTFIGSSYILFSTLLLCSFLCFLGYIFLSKKSEDLILNIDEFSKDLSIILSREMEKNKQYIENNQNKVKFQDDSQQNIEDNLTEDKDDEI